MSEYRTPEENVAETLYRARVQVVLDRAVQDGASVIIAQRLGEPADVVERWVNRVWDGLRDNLRDDRPRQVVGDRSRRYEDRLTAIVILLEQRALSKADEIMAGVRKAGGPS